MNRNEAMIEAIIATITNPLFLILGGIIAVIWLIIYIKQ